MVTTYTPRASVYRMEQRRRRRYNYTLADSTVDRLREYAREREQPASQVVEEAVLRLIDAKGAQS